MISAKEIVFPVSSDVGLFTKLVEHHEFVCMTAVLHANKETAGAHQSAVNAPDFVLTDEDGFSDS